MKSRIKYWMLSLVILISLVATACNNVETSGKEERQRVVAEVNGVKILNGELLDSYDVEKQYYGITEEMEKDPEQQETIKMLKSNVLENLIYQELMIQKANEAGFKIADGDLEQAKKEFEELLGVLAEQMKAQAGGDSAEGTDYKDEARKYVDEQLKSMGKTQDEYIKLMAEQTMVGKFVDDILKDIKGSDEDIQSYYDSQLAYQKQSTTEASTVDVELYKLPEVRVKHILIGLPDDQKTEYNNLLSEQKEEEAKKYLDEKLKEIYPKAQDVFNKAKSGEDFEKLIEEYGNDPGMAGNEEGYFVQQNGRFVAEFEDASFKLQAGEISKPVATSYGYHIIKSYERMPEKVFNIDEKREEIKKVVDEQKKDEKFDILVTEWMEAATINRYEDMI